MEITHLVAYEYYYADNVIKTGQKLFAEPTPMAARLRFWEWALKNLQFAHMESVSIRGIRRIEVEL